MNYDEHMAAGEAALAKAKDYPPGSPARQTEAEVAAAHFAAAALRQAEAVAATSAVDDEGDPFDWTVADGELWGYLQSMAHPERLRTHVHADGRTCAVVRYTYAGSTTRNRVWIQSRADGSLTRRVCTRDDHPPERRQ